MTWRVYFCCSVVRSCLIFETPWTAACQASLSFTTSWSLPKLMSTESVMPSNHLILCHPLILPSVFPSIRIFSNESTLASGGQSVGISGSASVLPMNIQGWFLLELTDLISLQFKGLSKVFSKITDSYICIYYAHDARFPIILSVHPILEPKLQVAI